MRIRGELGVSSGGYLGAVTCRVDLSLSRAYCRFCALGRVYLLPKCFYVRGCIVLGITKIKKQPDLSLGLNQ